MPTDFKLTPMPGTGTPRRWRKKDKRLPGGMMYFPVNRGETKEQSYRRCFADWQEIEKQLNAVPVHDVSIWQTIEYNPPADDPEPMSEATREELRGLGYDPDKVRLQVVKQTRTPDVYPSITNPVAFVDRLRNGSDSETERVTVGQEAKRQTESKHTKARSKQLATKTAQRFEEKLRHFTDWIGAAFPVNKITTQTLLDYHSVLLGELESGKRTIGGARDQQSAAIHFVRSAYVAEVLPQLPRVLTMKSGELSFAGANGKSGNRRDTANWYKELDKLRNLLNAAKGRTKLYVLLGLNCGYQQTDISELGQDEIDYSSGRIKRKRSKGERWEHVPEVDYLLWDETLALLLKYKAPKNAPHNRKGQPRAILNSNGNPLLTDTDTIKLAWNRLADTHKIKGKPFASLRKTSSTLLRHSDSFQDCRIHFLGQSPESIADKHYTPPSQERMERAIQYLATLFLATTG